MLNLESEEWKMVHTGAPYMVSNMGNVVSLARIVRCGPNNGCRKTEQKKVKPYVCKQTGYLQLSLHRKKYSLHRLVAIAFLGLPPTEKHQVNHINGVRTDSNVLNLEWVTPSQNVAHGFKSNGRIIYNKGISSGGKKVKAVDLKTGETLLYESGLHAEKDGFYSSGVSRCCHGLIESHKGKKWSFI